MLIVTRPFGSYRRGDVIADSIDISSVQNGVFRNHVVSTAAPTTPTPPPQPTEANAIAAGVAVGVAAAEAALHPASTPTK